MEFINRIKAFFLTGNNAEYTQPFSKASIEVVGSNQASKISPWSAQNGSLYSKLEGKYFQYFIGVSSLLEVSLNTFESDAIKSLEKTIKWDHSQTKDIPRLPGIVPKLLHLLKTDDFNWKQVADIIASDPVILVEIIKVANSSAYNLKVKDEQLEHIIAKMGLLEIRIAIMKVALKPIMMFESGYFLKHSGTKIWAHAVNTAAACRTLAEIYKYDPFDAYLAGILGNLGMVIVIKKLNEIKEFTIAPRSLQFQESLLKLSKHLSIKIAENWEMHPSIILALSEQFYSDEKRIESALGNIVYEATTVSMEYILVNKNLWLHEGHADNDDEYTPFDKAYKELASLNS